MRKLQIPKRSGGHRTVYVQDPRSKHKFSRVGDELTAKCIDLAPQGVVRGFFPGESPVTNARAHAHAKYALNMDLVDFFDHCTEERITAGLIDHAPAQWRPPNYEKNAKALAARAVYDGAARQGISSSPMAANISALPMDRDILAALPDGVTYTRYADDLTFSGDDHVALLTVRGGLPAIAARHGQEINPSKTRMQAATAGRMTITGVNVSDGQIFATRNARRKLRAARHNCRRITALIAVLCRLGRLSDAAILSRVNRRQFSQLRGLDEWTQLKFPHSTNQPKPKVNYEHA